MLHRLLHWLVAVGWWEPRQADRLWPGRPWLRFWRSPTNAQNVALLRLLDSMERRLEAAYQMGFERGQLSVTAEAPYPLPRRRSAPQLLH